MRMTHDDIKETLRLHKLWLLNDPNGVSANLSGADVCGADLWGADLSGAILYRANLDGANLTGCRVDVEAIASSEYPLSWWLERGAIVEE